MPVADTVLGAEDTAVNKTMSLIPLEKINEK